MSSDEEFQENFEYGRFAEEEIAKFFERKGYRVEFSEEYGVFDAKVKYRGPRIMVLLPINYGSIEEVEVSAEYLIAPDLRICNRENLNYIEVKRREHVSYFDNNEVIYINYKKWQDYCELDFFCQNCNYGDGVLLFIYLDEYRGESNVVFSATVDYLSSHIRYQRKPDFVSFNLRNFARVNDF
jgi:hypothetical protein